uniref:Uncharacterized protein n=1 Tax=Branchiostoma floridae TaxID=7739 RepID=C3ZAZ4_BRAFL|eukprot:XP_002594020.1 hypothetical protein BRAFLDRAFT_68540 [Branchiostoma floridae]
MQSSSTPNKPENRDSGQQQEPNNNYRSTWNTYSGNSNLHTNETAVFNHSAANWLYQHNGSTQNKLTSANRPQYKDAQYTELNSAYDSTKNRTAYLMQCVLCRDWNTSFQVLDTILMSISDDLCCFLSISGSDDVGPSCVSNPARPKAASDVDPVGLAPPRSLWIRLAP